MELMPSNESTDLFGDPVSRRGLAEEYRIAKLIRSESAVSMYQVTFPEKERSGKGKHNRRRHRSQSAPSRVDLGRRKRPLWSAGARSRS
jgi:hypothetical protein